MEWGHHCSGSIYGETIFHTKWLKACKSCQQAKTGVGPGKKKKKTDLVSTALERMACDLQDSFPESSQGNWYILIVHDYFSKWVDY